MSTLDATYDALAPARKRLFLAACIRHAAGAFGRVAGLPDRVRIDCVDAAVTALESGVAAPTDAANACFDELDESDLQALVGACIEGLQIASGATKPMHLVLNNLEEMISIVDPDENESGTAEEMDHFERIAEALATPDGPGALPALVGAVLGWEERWKADFAR